MVLYIESRVRHVCDSRSFVLHANLIIVRRGSGVSRSPAASSCGSSPVHLTNKSKSRCGGDTTQRAVVSRLSVRGQIEVGRSVIATALPQWRETNRGEEATTARFSRRGLRPLSHGRTARGEVVGQVSELFVYFLRWKVK